MSEVTSFPLLRFVQLVIPACRESFLHEDVEGTIPNKSE
jgi:hypothetical protein